MHDRAAPALTADPQQRRSWLTIAVALTLAALALRALFLPLATRHGYWGDHDDFARWGIQAVDRGVLTLYDAPPARWDNRYWKGGEWHVTQRELDRLCNYPPASAYLLYASGLMHKSLDPTRLINTTVSRAVYASWSIVADILLAAGCAAIVALYRPGAPAWSTYALMLFVPPFWLDSAFWGQMDSLLLAPMVWMLWAMLAGRWLTAGALLGAAAMLKPQAILLLPVWGWAVLLQRPMRKPLAGLAVAACVVCFVSLPFTLHSGLAWLRASYAENMLNAHPETTMKAFNIWYPDLLIRDSSDVRDRLLGLSRDAWGRIALIAAVAAGFGYLVIRRRRDPRVLLWWAAWILLAAVIFPTRVHERYLLIPLALLLVGGMLTPRLRAPAFALAVVAVAQVTWPLWMPLGAGDWRQYEAMKRAEYDARLASLPPEELGRAPAFDQLMAPARKNYLDLRARTIPYEWFLTLLALGATAWSFVALAEPDKLSSGAPKTPIEATSGDSGPRD